MQTTSFKLQQYTMVTFILSDETITKYFQGNPTFSQIKLIIGGCEITDIQKVKGNFQPDYKIDKSRFGGYYTV